MLLEIKRILKMRLQLSVFIIAFSVLLPVYVQAQLQPDEEATIKVFEKASPAVVFIKNASLQWDGFSMYVYEVPQGAGSGFIWDDQGHIVTNFHVLYQADSIEVTLSDKKTYKATVVGVAPDYDLAVIKVDAPKDLFKSINLGSSKDLKVGQRALSIGNPFGLDCSLSTGVISALGRSMRSVGGREIHDVIQTDAAINPGNSGGPLLDSRGDLIGVSTMIYSPSGASAGVGFAIPVDVVKRVVPQLVKYGKLKKVGLDVVFVPDSIREQLGISGAMILQVQEGSGAEQAGLKGTQRNLYGNLIFGDIIVSVDNHHIENNEDILGYFDNKNSGDNVHIKFLRDANELETTIALEDL